MIVYAVDLARSRRARGRRDDAGKGRVLGDQPVAERAFAGAGGAGEDEQDGRFGAHGEIST